MSYVPQKVDEICSRITPLSKESLSMAWEYLDTLAIPRRSLGQLMDFAAQISAAQENLKPSLKGKEIHMYCADHKIAERGVSASPIEITAQQAVNAAQGGSGVAAMASTFDIDVRVYDIGIVTDYPKGQGVIDVHIADGVQDILSTDAMTEDELTQAFLASINEVITGVKERDLSIVGTGEVGIGNTTPSSAIISFVLDMPIEQVVGMGSGLSQEGVEFKRRAVEKIIKRNDYVSRDNYFEIMRTMGGLDLAGMAGTILGAAYCKIPVVVDGIISLASAIIACGMYPAARDYIIPSHMSEEPATMFVLDHLNLKAPVHMGMRLGEGSGATLGIAIADCACHMMRKLKSFEAASITHLFEEDEQEFGSLAD